MEIPVKSATEAMRMKQLLRSHGIRAHVGKRSGEDGCFFYLTVSDKKHPDVLHLLERYN